MNNRADLLLKAQAIFREVFEDPSLVIQDKMVASQVKNWDSLNHITLVMTLEERFNVKFTTREVMGWKNIGEIIDTIAQKSV